MTMSDIPPTNEPGAPGSPVPYVQKRNADNPAPVTEPAAPQGFNRIGHLFAAIAVALGVIYFVYAAHYDMSAPRDFDHDGGRGALIWGAFVAAGIALAFYVTHHTRKP